MLSRKLGLGQLRNFVVAAEALNTARTAERLQTAQTPLGRKILVLA